MDLCFILFRAVSPKWTARVLPCFERSALDNRQLEFIVSNCFERSALDNGQLEFIFSNCFEQSVLDNGQLEFIFYLVSSGQP